MHGNHVRQVGKCLTIMFRSNPGWNPSCVSQKPWKRTTFCPKQASTERKRRKSALLTWLCYSRLGPVLPACIFEKNWLNPPKWFLTLPPKVRQGCPSTGMHGNHGLQAGKCSIIILHSNPGWDPSCQLMTLKRPPTAPLFLALMRHWSKNHEKLVISCLNKCPPSGNDGNRLF